MSDVISRQAAIDAIYETFCYAYCDNCEKEMNEDLCGDCHRKYQNWAASKKIISKTMNSLPSAQPEIITCKDCLMHGVCRFEQGLGLDGYCSQAERRTDETD